MKENKKEIFKIISILTIIFISLIPVFFSWGRLLIGGDMMIPFNSESLKKYLFQWINIQNGQYFSINYYPLYFFYKITGFFNIGVYYVSAIFLFLLNFVTGIGILKIARLFSAKKDYLLLFPIIFYMLSPALLNSWHYIFIYSFTPLFFYFIFKIIKNKNAKISDVLFLNILIFFISIDLPNPKYIFHIFLISFLIFVASFLLKLIDKQFFIKNLSKVGLFFLLAAYIFLPLFNFVSSYKAEDYGTKTRANYKDTGKFMDEGSTTIDRMLRIHSDGLVVNTPEQEKYKLNRSAQFLSFIFILIIALLLFKRSFDITGKKYELVIFLLLIIYLFFAVGPNPPFGLFYKFLVAKLSLFAFLRTTAGAVFFLSLFYALLLFIFLKNTYKKRQPIYFILLLCSLFIVSYPLINGEFYKNVNAINPFTNRNEYGYKIPDEYFMSKIYLENNKIEGKLFFPNSKLSYLNTDWGYFGPMLYNFLYKNNPIYKNGIEYLPQFHNVDFVLRDNSESNIIKKEGTLDTKNFNETKRIGFLAIERLDRSVFLPIIYTSNDLFLSKRKIEELPKIVSNQSWQTRSVVFFENQNEGKGEMLEKIKSESVKIPLDLPLEKGEAPVLEFKKINPTKYRVRVHSATGEFPLVFSESFHDGWKAYLSKPSSKEWIPDQAGNDNVGKYKILDGNEDDQATKDELVDFIQNGWVSDLGPSDFSEKLEGAGAREIKHMKWNEEKQKEELDYVEKYNIDFISKNFQGTIQNDNLPSKPFYETWFAQGLDSRLRGNDPSHKSGIFGGAGKVLELPEEKHLMVNGYANSWIVDPATMCQQVKSLSSLSSPSSYCIKNKDGSYDFEMVVEFWPQRLFYVGVGISGTTLLLCLAYLGYDYYRRKKSKGQTPRN